MVGGNAPFSTEEELCRHLDDAYGLRSLKTEWISRNRASLQNSLIRSICNLDIREISHGSLPWRLQDAHSVRLGVKLLVQIDEVINITAPDRKAPTPRMLQFALTDGVVNFIAFELDPAQSSFTTDTIPRTKLVLLPSALVRRGRVILTSADYTLLGPPQRSVRISGTGRAEPGSVGFVRARESTGSNIGGSSGDRSLNPSATNIIDVGGIADIAEPRDEVEENDGLWVENPTPSSLFPARMRDGVLVLPMMGMDTNSGMEGSVQRSPSVMQEPNNTNEAHAGRIGRFELTHELRASATTRSPSSGGQRRNGSVIKDDAERELTFQEYLQMPNEARSPEAEIEDSEFEMEEPIQGLERRDIIDPESPKLVRLSHLWDGADSCAVRTVLCRFYAMKTAKRTDYQLKTERFTSTVVDDGTFVRVVTLSNELVNNLRDNFPKRTEEYSQTGVRDLRRSLRSICGFVRVECQDKVPVATSLVSEAPVSVSRTNRSNHEGAFVRDRTRKKDIGSDLKVFYRSQQRSQEQQSSMLSQFLDEVAERYDIHAAR